MENKKFLKNIIKVVSSNICIILSGIFVGFVIPKIMGATNYGNYKIFSLYLSYIGLFNLGFVEGIYLKYGGIEYEKIDKEKFRTYTKVLFFTEIFLTALIFLFAILFLKDNYKLIFIFIAISIVPKIMTGYYQFISQMTSRFNELSFRNLINSILTIFVIVLLYFLYKIGTFENLNYSVYIILTILIFYILMLWYIKTYKDITIGNSLKIRDVKVEIKEFIILGFPLLISNLIGTLILSMDRQFVSLLFETEIYGVYSFAYNIIALAMTAVTAVSSVLYPTLKKKTSNEIINIYDKLMKNMMIIIFALLGGFYILIPIISKFLPSYIDSIEILRVIFPTIAIQSAITLIIHNYYKVFQQTNIIFKQSIVILMLSILANAVAYSIFKTPIAISVASVIIMYIWYIISEYKLKKEYKLKTCKNFIYMNIMISLFYFTTTIDNKLIGIILYIISYLIITIIFFIYKKQKIYMFN